MCLNMFCITFMIYMYILRGNGWTAQRSTMNVRLSLKSSSWRKKRRGEQRQTYSQRKGPFHLPMRRTMSRELSSDDTIHRWMEHQSNGWWAVDSVYAHSHIPYTTSVMFTFDGSLIWSAQVNVRKGLNVFLVVFNRHTQCNVSRMAKV